MGIPQADSEAWWTEVEHLRERIERRRAQEVSLAATRARRAAAAEAQDGAQRRSPHAAQAIESASLAPRRTVHIRGRTAPPIVLPRLRPLEDASELDVVEAREVAGATAERSGAKAERSGAKAERSGAKAERSGAKAERSGAKAERSGAKAERSGPWARPYSAHRRPRRPVSDRLGGRPDRMAMWAFALAVLTVLIALLSAH